MMHCPTFTQNQTNAILLAIANEQYKAAHALLHCDPAPALDIHDRVSLDESLLCKSPDVCT